jgi:hypothetical protein
MEGFTNSIITGLRSRKFKIILQQKCQEWRENSSQYFIDYAVTHFIDGLDAQNLFDTLSDPYFRQLKREYSGLNSLRSDLQKGLEFFSTNYPNIIRYLQIFFLQARVDIENSKEIDIHQEYCKEFSDFLQLDTPSQLRKNIGIQRVLNRVFPIEINKNSDKWFFDSTPETANSIAIEILDYQLGNWHCRCGDLKGYKHRHEYTCKCGSIKGNGLLDQSFSLCNDCNNPPEYMKCSLCGTRVNLDIIWKIKEGSLHFIEFQIPLNLTLSIKKSTGLVETMNLLVMHFPIMVGIQEIHDHLCFELPALFWVNDFLENSYLQNRGLILYLKDQIKYDRQTKFCKILEAIMMRSFRYPVKSRPLDNLFKRIFFPGKDQSNKTNEIISRITNKITERFIRRLSRLDGMKRDADLMQFINISLKCRVASSSRLRHRMALVNCSLLRPAAFHTSYMINKVFTLEARPFRKDIFTPRPLGKETSSALDENGIIRVGSIVYPGDVLVGVESLIPDPEEPPEEKLLRAIFGEKSEKSWLTEDSSFLYSDFQPAKVVDISIIISQRWGGTISQIETKKYVQYGTVESLNLDDNKLIQISINLVTYQTINVGDILYGSDGTEAVICDIVGGSELTKLTGCLTEPDIVVAPDHPWNHPKNSGADLQYILINKRGDSWLTQEASGHGTVSYQPINERPIKLEENPNPPQKLQIEDLEWLLACDAMYTAYELFGMHSDCFSWRNEIIDSIVKGCFQIKSFNYYNQSHFQDLIDLIDVPIGTLQSLAFFLKGLGIKVTLQFSNPLSLRFQLISDDEKISESKGEVTKPETINYRTLKPEMDGLFCERIFGPSKDWECGCGKYKRVSHRGIVCERCGVEVTESKVRRYRMSFIKLAAPVIHIWYLKYISILLDMSLQDVEKIIYFNAYVVLNPGNASNLQYKQLLTEDQLFEIEDQIYAEDSELSGIEVGIGAEALRRLLQDLDLKYEAAKLSEEVNISERQERDKLIERLHLLNNLITTGYQPEWMVLTTIPVIPPDLRPIVTIEESGRFVTSDLNDLYQRVINRNNCLARLEEILAPEIITRNEKLELQKSVDALIDNGRQGRTVVGDYNRPLQGLTNHFSRYLKEDKTLLEGLLNQPIDFSGQTRLVVGEVEDLDTVLFPESIAWVLLELPIVHDLLVTGQVNDIKSAKEEISRKTHRAYQALQQVVKWFVIAFLGLMRYSSSNEQTSYEYLVD